MKSISHGQHITDAWLAGIPLAHVVSKMAEDGYSEACIDEAMDLYDSLDDWHDQVMQPIYAAAAFGDFSRGPKR